MRAYFRWYKAPVRHPEVGDRRIVSKFIICRTINGETRGLGTERIEQEAYLATRCIPESRMTYKVLAWKDVAWVDPWP